MKVACSASLSIAGITSALLVVARPCPARYLAERVQLVVAVGVRVLHRHPRAELDVLAHGLAKPTSRPPSSTATALRSTGNPLHRALVLRRLKIGVDRRRFAAERGSRAGCPLRAGQSL